MKNYKSFKYFILYVFIGVLLFSTLSCKNQTEPEVKAEAAIPSIINISEDISTYINSNIKIFIEAEVSDKGTLSYQWYSAENKLKEGSAIENATEAAYAPDVRLAGSKYYYCTVTNTFGESCNSAISPRILVTVESAINAENPTITTQPINISGKIDEDFAFSVSAASTDGGVLTYQWYFSKNEEEAKAIKDATSPTYSEKVSLANIGYYYCEITNTINDNGDSGSKSASIQTNTVILSDNVVNANIPVITGQSKDIVAILPAETIFTVSAYSPDNGSLTYQWYSLTENEETGNAILGATGTDYKITASTPEKTGFYCVITNNLTDNGDGGKKSASITSETVWFETIDITDSSSFVITQQPCAMSIAAADTKSVTLKCKAELESGFATAINYAWYESPDGTSLVESELFSEDTSNISQFTSPDFSEKGIRYFYCVASPISSYNGKVNKEKSIVSNIVSVAFTGLPTLFLNTGETPTNEITRENYVLGTFKLISENFSTVEYKFSKIKDGKIKEGIKGRGNSSWGMPKKGYNIKFDKKQSLFGLPEAKKWCIVANYSDKTLLRNKFVSVLGKEVFNNGWNPTFINIDVIMNGEYLGNYTLCEKNTIGIGRVDIQDISDLEENLTAGKESKISDENNDGQKTLDDGGFILEVDTKSRIESNDIYVQGEKSGKNFVLKDPDEVSDIIKEFVNTKVQDAENVLYGDNFTNNENGWRKYIDENSVIDWYIVNEFTKNNDAIFFSSVYIYFNPSDEKFHLGPNWDFDISCGNINYNNCDNPEGFWIKDAAWISRMFQDPLFITNIKNRWNEKKSDLYNVINGNFNDQNIQSLADENFFSAEYNFYRWQILGKYVWPNASGFEERMTYQSEVDYMIEWLNSRYDWLDTAINLVR